MCMRTGVFQDIQHQGLRAEGVGRGEDSGQSVRTYLSHLWSCEAARAVLHMHLHLFMCDCVYRCTVSCACVVGGQYVRAYQRVQISRQTPGVTLRR